MAEEQDAVNDFLNDTDLWDPVVKLGNPLLEVVLPDDEPTLFAALRYEDIDMVKRQLREGIDLNAQKEGKVFFYQMTNRWVNATLF